MRRRRLQESLPSHMEHRAVLLERGICKFGGNFNLWGVNESLTPDIHNDANGTLARVAT